MKEFRQMIKLRPHHLLDIIRDYGNDIDRKKEHQWGAMLVGVTNELLKDLDQTIELVIGVDSICMPCSRLEEGICEARLGGDQMMRDYNDPLDRALFDALNLKSGSQMTAMQFLILLSENMEILNLFTRPAGKSYIRENGTTAALVKFGIAEAI